MLVVQPERILLRYFVHPVTCRKAASQPIDEAVTALFHHNLQTIYRRTDKVFAGLMVFQYFAGIVIALLVSPRSWSGEQSQIHLHVWAAIFLGGAITAFPVYLAFAHPGKAFTRHTIASGQMLTSALLIHLTGGQIETHFHVFGSLAFLAFYRDWRVLITATVLVYVDHLLRGIYWPQSVYGVLSASIWRTMEHAGWVMFEVAFLMVSIAQSRKEMQLDASHTIELMKEISERKIAEDALRASQERFEIAVRGSNDGLWDWNIVTDQTYYSPRFKELLGYAENEFEFNFQEWESLLHPEDRECLANALREHLESNSRFDVEARIQTRNGDYNWFRLRGQATRNSRNKALRMAGSLLDITNRKLIEQQLRHDAYHDSLTGLPNRAAFVDNLERAIGRTKRRPEYTFAVLFLDLDRFKVINDSLGHVTGDRLIVEVARRLLDCLRTGDIVARLGGDEFTIFVDDVHAYNDGFIPGKVAKRVLDALSRPFVLNGQEVYSGASVGIAMSSAAYVHADDILRDADTAMYRAKSAGRGRYEIFDAEMHESATALLLLESDLRRALEREQLLLHYQPIVSISTAKVTGFEALLRWRHPERGFVAPGEFIELAEETGLIVPIGEWVLREACRWLHDAILQEAFTPEITISVNVAGRQFSQPEFISTIATVLKETGLDPHRLKLEITESTVMERAHSAATLAQLREMNVQLMVDDFGTGYSSLSYLSRFPLNALKIDRSFVSTLGSEEDSSEIVRCILVLADTLNLDVIAEGVETREQADILESLGCRLCQGFYYSRPIDGASAQKLVSGDPLKAAVSDL